MEAIKKRPARGMDVDLIHGPIFRNLLWFAVPIFISNLFQQLYNAADTMIVGNVLGDSALAAVGACGSIYELLVGFGLGIGNGLAIVTARAFGAEDYKRVRQSVAWSMIIGIVASLIITAVGMLFLHPLLVLLDTPTEILEDAYSYISVIALFVLVMFAYNLCAALLRAIGNSVMPLVFLVFSSCLNVGLDILFITRFNMGVAGAAVATVIAQAVSVVLCILYILKKTEILVPRREHFAYDRGLVKELVGQGLSMGLMSSIVSAGSVILQYGINGLGTLVIAGHTAARKLFALTDMPVMAISMAAATFVSQNRGASQPQRVRQGMRQTFLFCIGTAVVMSLLMLVSARWLVGLVSGSSEPVVLDNGAAYLIWNAPFYSVLGILLATRYALQSLGQKVLPLISSGIEFVGKILFVLFFIPRFEYMAVILCEPIIWCFMCAQLLYVYFRDPFIRSASAAPEKAES
ncbi:MAG TPA: MATE family efflux transporter [Candidatus Faecalibacterium intestinipullorum]|uniref:Probable multidrug resistance protein NorM n=1 Tax=Faecalibacterium gallinarum TaxID=2903556 RepID=A0AA37IY80_9FIRM|nr:MATE family efflux transporter [Faecalibacterium gallinarum]GJN64159.1 MATE family efflux transporter [Faecalibacterium gallinarum]HIV50056.1 MATE family efflux transporter [Candidatus Faecalibacterium intestinipullorum]